MRGGTAESRVVPLRKKSDILEGWAQKGGGVLYLEGLPGPKLAGSGGSEQGLSARSHKTEEVEKEQGNGLDYRIWADSLKSAVRLLFKKKKKKNKKPHT